MTKKDFEKLSDNNFHDFWTRLYQGDFPRSNDMREAIYTFGDPGAAYWYARKCDGPHIYTRKIACKDPKWALLYAMYVDKKPHPDTENSIKTVVGYYRGYQQWENSIKKI